MFSDIIETEHDEERPNSNASRDVRVSADGSR